MIKEEYKYSEITGKMIGCAMKVYQKIRNGYRELIYHRCWIIEFKKENIIFPDVVELPIFMKGLISALNVLRLKGSLIIRPQNHINQRNQYNQRSWTHNIL
jgi:GxxExxY protein